MNRFADITVTIGLSALLSMGLACGNDTTNPEMNQGEPNSPAQVIMERTSLPETLQLPDSAPASSIGPAYSSSDLASSRMPLVLAQGTNSQTGIWVTGEGSLTMEPDLALLSIGVEASANTVREANTEAAKAMDSIVSVLNDQDIGGSDIQTRTFNIYPEYEYVEATVRGRRTSKQELVGYKVANSVSVKVRNLKIVGEIIDDITMAGGSATRINGISFTVENPETFMEELREQAVSDAIAKASQFAFLTNVVRGAPIFISEVGRDTPTTRNLGFDGRIAFAESAGTPSTPIMGGDLELQLSVQVVFEIQ